MTRLGESGSFLKRLFPLSFSLSSECENVQASRMPNFLFFSKLQLQSDKCRLEQELDELRKEVDKQRMENDRLRQDIHSVRYPLIRLIAESSNFSLVNGTSFLF